MDKRVMEIVEESKKRGLPITRATIMSFGHAAKMAVLAADTTTDAEKDKLKGFGASEKWARNFIARNNLGGTTTEAVEQGMEVIREECKKYETQNVFNVHETCLFYRLMPKRSYLSKGERRKTARGTEGMTAKDRVTAYVCTNATGTAKVPMSIVGKSKMPRCFRRKLPPMSYFSQCDAWSDSATVRRWWLDVFLPFVRKWTHLPVLCLMDGSASDDLLMDPKGQVTAKVYPPSCTSRYKPMLTGVIAATKRHYRRRLLNVRVSTIAVAETLRAQARERNTAAGTAGLAEGHAAHVLDAAELLHAAWEDIREDTIAR